MEVLLLVFSLFFVGFVYLTAVMKLQRLEELCRKGRRALDKLPDSDDDRYTLGVRQSAEAVEELRDILDN